MCEKIITSAELKKELVLDSATEKFIEQSRETIKNILTGKDKRFLVIVGPCSIHDINQGLDYAKKLKEFSQNLENVFVVLRAYFEKPRTSIGWKGLIQDPDLDCSYDIEKGLKLARKFLLEVSKLSLPVASELLEPLQVPYYVDLLSYGAIWARTVESQPHREIVSGLESPVWMKNSTSGDIVSAINAILASRLSHTFLTINDEWSICKITTDGNEYAHLILRWWTNWPNYQQPFIEEAIKLLKQNSCLEAIIVDASHQNSGKKAVNQPKVVEEVLALSKKYPQIKGVMIESNIYFWNQKFDPCKDDKNKLKYGVSITDECISLEQTKELLEKINNFNLL